MKASDLLVKCLENEGLKYIFGVPGEENADFMISLEGSSITFVMTRHEQGAAFMAEAYGRLTGEPAGCLSTLGPGATNLITGVADSNMDRAPMIVLTGQGATGRQHKESHQVMDVVRMFDPVTKWAHQIVDADTIPEIVRKAFRLAKEEKPGAVLIELPEDVAKRDATTAPLNVIRVRRPSIDDKTADYLYDELIKAKRPVILAGNGAIRRRASKQLRQFCEATGIGCLSTFMAKGAVDRHAPYSLFTLGLGSRDFVADAIDGADLVLVIGYDMVEYHPKLWNPWADKKVVHIDFIPAEVDRFYAPCLECVGDIAHTLWALNERIKTRGLPTYDLGYQANVRQRMIADFEAHKDDVGEGPIRPQKALWDLREVMGPEDVVLSGVGAHKMWTARYYQCDEPNTCLIPNGFCSMGQPLPGAVGARLSLPPERKIFGVVGDGDFMMNVQELETARRLNADINLMVWVDDGYGLIAWKQENEFHKHTDLSFGNPDWMKLAEAFDWHGQWVERPEDLKAALMAALNHQGPSFVALPIDYRENRKLTERLGEIEVQL
ncbi:acetolactate synthase [Parvularcula bermudensis HTCC2503]|uniref:Acetolactate synthase n=1 Tax=Parvularcula bermudensis (strain ATCC BAA-594 / HTCC2503 / KCTC 12087) TaxID=314260 RepID=E0THL5_PARBH|nr:acetolactate synthase large subunit [Parvularcula bermudensis]ADM09311.1 acetolactate synthase [Parvularcula bermudensis HTCC2503]